jgi:hypothetical protein
MDACVYQSVTVFPVKPSVFGSTQILLTDLKHFYSSEYSVDIYKLRLNQTALKQD